MVKGSQVTDDYNSIVSSLDEATTQVSGIGQNWVGESYDSFSTKYEEFINEYKTGIETTMTAFSTACDLYEEYVTAKSKLATAKSNYSSAKEKYESDNSSANQTSMNTYSSEVDTYSSEVDSLKTKIEAQLTKASSVKLTAEAATAGGLATSVVESITGVSATSATSATDTSWGNVDVSGYDINNYPTANNLEQGKIRAVLIAKYLMANGDFTKEQACAIAGVHLDGNKCNPSSYNKQEKQNKGTKLTQNGGYGAGIGSWTGVKHKQQVLADAGFSKSTAIESLSLKQQCDMIIAESKNSRKKYFNALRRCTNIEDATATCILIQGGPGYFKNWSTSHPTMTDAKKIADVYKKGNNSRFGKSSYHANLDTRRLGYAKEIYNMF